MGRRVKLKKICMIPLCVLIFLTFGVRTYADGGENVNNIIHTNEGETAAVQGADDILSDFEELLPEEFEGISEDPSAVLDRFGIEAILAEFILAINGERTRVASFFLTALGVAVLMAVTSRIAREKSPLSETVVCAVCALTLYHGLVPLVEEAGAALEKVGEFFFGLSSVLASLTIAGGGINTAATQGAGMSLTLSLFGGYGGSFLMSLVCVMFALGLVGTVAEGGISSLARGIKSLFTWGLGILTTSLLGILSLQSFVSRAADTAVLRAAKYAATGMIPIVGSTVSAALSTLVSGLSYAGGIVGGASVAVILSLALSPVVVMLLYRLCLSLVMIFLEFAGSAGGVRCFTAMRSAFDSLIAVYVLSCIVYIFEIILYIKCGTSII